MKKLLFILLIIACIYRSSNADTPDKAVIETMEAFDAVMSEIGKLPGMIDEALCNNDRIAYRTHMTELAQNIVKANTIISDIHLYYPIDLWSVYNRISYNPVCGSALAAEEAFLTANVSRISNEEKMELLQNKDLCMCWNIAVGREEPTGFWKDGACRCTYGTRAYNPDIGKN